MNVLQHCLLLVLSGALAGCFPEPGDSQNEPRDSGAGEGGAGVGGNAGSGGSSGTGGDSSGNGGGGSGGDGATGGSGGGPAKCGTTRSSEPIPAREAAIVGTEGDVQDEYMLVSELFEKFKNQCGACHVDQPVVFQTSEDTFVEDFEFLWIERIRSDAATGPTAFMPPPAAGGKPFSERGAEDPTARLAELLELWDEAGRPPDLFRLKTGGTTEKGPYTLGREVGEHLTNIGNCVPARAGYATETDKMRELDDMFASLTHLEDLPDQLHDTDLVSFDAEALARLGLVAYAPNYPLFSDGAKKLRHIRTPVGKSLHYDRKTGEFEIPDNTRVYKTFLKEVIDNTGRRSFRKIETRIIVARHDASDGVAGVRAIYGSYVWNEAETEAVLHRDRLRNGQPFTDLVFTYILDEPKVAKILEDLDPDLDIPGILRNEGLTRTWAIPSSTRCVECHMGSLSKSFLVGVTPLQAARRLPGHGGTITNPGPDELTQLQRYIDYGVVTGLDSADDVLRLEASQGDAKSRSDLEERAQGYMLGNCAFCHNPRGFPSQTKPELSPMLDFWPRAADGKQAGGIFQFPLERYSPRVVRNTADPVPYITPSVYPAGDHKVVSTKVTFPNGTTGGKDTFIHAPWRSLIYRNVDTPFTYAEDQALFQHMPRNVAGFDCTAPTIFGEWMVSIPAKLKNPELTPDKQPESQPYVEVKAGEEGFTLSATLARQRLADYRKGLRNKHYYCPNTTDTIDPQVKNAPGKLSPLDLGSAPSHADASTSEDPFLQALSILPDKVPDHVHWITSDLTNPVLTDWYPRRGDWKAQLVDGEFGGDPVKDPQAATVAQVLSTLELTESLRNFALTVVPTTVWLKKDGCDFAGETKIADLSDPPAWVATALDEQRITKDDFAYSQPSGEMAFREICAHCHGNAADSGGLQAQQVLELSGGNTRVADFKEGFFGPSTNPGAYREKVFAEAEGGHETWGPRYLAWMALGGTNSLIPEMVLGMVGGSPVLGEVRPQNPGAATANMLSIAKNLCLATLPDVGRPFDLARGGVNFDFYFPGSFSKSGLISSNGDLDLWLQLCTWGNPSPVRIVTVLGGTWTETAPTLVVNGTLARYRRDHYPASAPVGDPTGKVQLELTDLNLDPWCVAPPTDAAQLALAETHLKSVLGDGPLPFCPVEYALEAYEGTKEGSDSPFKKEFDQILELWGTRGAANAGLAVYSYLDAMLGGEIKPKPSFEQCEQLNKGGRKRARR